MRSFLLVALGLVGNAAAQEPLVVPIEQITRPQGAMGNELIGTGLITGLNGTGAKDKVSRQAAQNLIRNLGLNIGDTDLTTGSFALVMVNVTLPPFSKEGQLLDVKVSAMSDATSLFGGYLQYATLQAIDGEVYAEARGPVTVSGFSASAQGTSVVRNHVTVGNVPDGAKVVRAARSYYLSQEGHVELQLINPDLRTATNIAEAINQALAGSGATARPIDRTMVRIEVPSEQQSEAGAMRLLTLIRPLPVEVHDPTVVIIDAAAGVVLAGQGVMISPCVVALSDLTISVVSQDEVSQPLPGPNLGTTETVNRTRIDVQSTNSELKPVAGGATVDELLGNLKALELSPRQLIQVFEHLKSGGYLQADLRVR
ncbi:MAG: flagellar basal body P-ring protein FlgI [Planctomycetota bacterium]